MDVIEYLRERPQLLAAIFMMLLTLALVIFRIGRPVPARTYRQGCIAGLVVGMWISVLILTVVGTYLIATGRLVL